MDLLEQARAKREQAERCRSFASDVEDRAAAELLNEYALDLEERSQVLERLAGDSRPATARTEANRRHT
jgi:hypothetical protein